MTKQKVHKTRENEREQLKEDKQWDCEANINCEHGTRNKKD